MEAGASSSSSTTRPSLRSSRTRCRPFARCVSSNPLVELKTEVAPGLPNIYVDRAALVDAIGNLLATP